MTELNKLVLSPKKVKSSCFIHRDGFSNDEKLYNFTEHSWETIRKASVTRHDDGITETINSNIYQDFCYHKSCYSSYTHPKTLKAIERKYIEELAVVEISPIETEIVGQTRVSSRRKDGRSTILADTECCICSKRKTKKGGSGYETLEKCLTEMASLTLQQCALRRKSPPQLLADIIGLDWKRIVAKEFVYHRTCYRDYTRPEKPKEGASTVVRLEDVFNVVKNRVIDNGEVLDVADLMSVADVEIDIRTLKQRLSARFEDDVGFWSPRYGKSFIYSERIPKGQIIEVGSSQIRKATADAKEPPLRQKIIEIAKVLRNEVNMAEPLFKHWPPSEEQLLNANVDVPPLLECFLSALLSSKSHISPNKKRSIEALAQDVIFKVRNGRYKPLKHVLLSLCTKRKTGSKQLIQWLNRLGHGISYDDVNCLETGLAEAQMYEKALKTYVPSNIQPSQFVTFIWDNNDINPETLSGVSMHCTNGIIVQLPHSSNMRLGESAPIAVPESSRSSRKRSFIGMHSELEPYYAKKRVDPKPFSNVASLYEKYHLKESWKVDVIWTILRFFATTTRKNIPNWTGFNYLIEKEINVSCHEIGYLPAIDQSPTTFEVVIEVLKQSKIKAEVLGLTEVDVVMDQAIYAKAVEIMLHPIHAELANFTVLRMGGFHTSCNFMSIIGKRFADAGMRDLVVEAGILGEGSVERMMSGKHYNNGIRVLKYLYDVMSRLRFEVLDDWLSENKGHESLEGFLTSYGIQISMEDINHENFNKLLVHEEIFDIFAEFSDFLRNTSQSGPTAVFWTSFLDMMNILFAFLRSTKIGNWYLHLEATSAMLPWMFAYDHQNYSRYLTYYWAQMTKLPSTHPNIYSEFISGNFSVRRTSGKFNKVPSDQCIEQTINREQKGHGGIKGYSTSVGTIQRWVLTSHVTSKCFSNFESMLSVKKTDTVPKDLGQSRMNYDNGCVERAVSMLASWGNPFSYRETLVNICSGLEAPEDVQNDLLNVHEMGKKELETFLKSRLETNETSFFSPIKKLKLKTFKDTRIKQVCNVKAKSVTIAAERSIFGKLLIIAQQRREVSMREVLEYSLGPLPWPFALPDGGLVKTSKSKLLEVVEEDVSTITALPNNCALIVDGMVVIQQADVSKLTTFGDLSKYILEKVMKLTDCAYVYFVTDQYKQNSIKSYERARRVSSEPIKYKIERRDQKLPKQFKRFLSGGENKEALVKFLCNDWGSSDEYKATISNRSLFVNVGDRFALIKEHDDTGFITMTDTLELNTSQEEADTKVFICCAHARDAGFSSACIFTVDSDIPLYALYFKEIIGIEVYVEIGVKNKRRRIDISAIFNVYGPSVSAAIPAIHSFTGNDYTSAFHGLGKKKAFKMLKSSELYQETFKALGNTFEFDESLFATIQKFVCELYGLAICNEVNEARYMKFCSVKKVPDPEKLPPTSDSLFYHCKRVSYATAIIKNALTRIAVIPSPDGFGWKVDDNGLNVTWMSQKPAPDAILELMSCGCKKAKCVEGSRCLCCSHGVPCTDLCSCKECDNMCEEEYINEEDVESITDDFDSDSE